VQLHALVGGAAEVIGAEATVGEAAERMVDQAVGCLAVVDGREIVGIITEHDVVRAIAGEADPELTLVTSVMTESPDTVPANLSVREAAAWLLETGYRHLPVMEGGELLGIVSIKDVLWALFQTE